MFDVRQLDASAINHLHAGWMARYHNVNGNETQDRVLRDANRILPGFTAAMNRNVRLMRPADAFEASILASLTQGQKKQKVQKGVRPKHRF